MPDESLASNWTKALIDIQEINAKILEFWGSGAAGWAPADVTTLLHNARLDRQLSLSHSLAHWQNAVTDSLSDGELILAWANLGSLIEGTMKLLLAVYYEDYKKDVTVKQSKAWHIKNDKPIQPETLSFEALIDYFQKADLLNESDIDLCKLVQSRRNAIHSFKDRSIGNAEEFLKALTSYCSMLRTIEGRLPYPY